MWQLVAEDSDSGCYANAAAGGEGGAYSQTISKVVHRIPQNDHDHQGHVACRQS